MRASPSPTPSLPPETQYRPAGSDEDDPEFGVHTLLAEDPVQRRYLVEWVDIDPSTNYAYEPTWEPKDMCTDALIQEWKQKIRDKEVKAGRKAGEVILAAWIRTRTRVLAERHAERKAKKRESLAAPAPAPAARPKKSSRAESNDAATAASKKRDQPAPRADSDGEREEEEEAEEDEEVMEVLMSSGDEGTNKKRKAKEVAKAKAKALADASQMTTTSEYLPPGGKRKRSSMPATAPAKKKRGRQSRLDSSEAAPAPAPAATKRTSGRTSKVTAAADGSPPIASRVRSRSISFGPSTSAAGAKANAAKPSSTRPHRKSGIAPQKNARFAPEPAEEDDDDFEILEPEEVHPEDDDYNNNDNFGFDGNDEPYRSPSPAPASPLEPDDDADKNARLAAVIRDLSTSVDPTGAPIIPSPTSSTDSDTIAQAVSAARDFESASFPDVDISPVQPAQSGKSKSRKEKEAGPSKPSKSLGAVPQPSTQTFRVAALQQQAADTGPTQSTGTQESIEQFSSPVGPSAKAKGKGKKRATKADMARAGAIRAEPLFMNTSSDEDEAAGVLRTEQMSPERSMPILTGEEDEESIPPGMERLVVDGVAMLRAIDATQWDGLETQASQAFGLTQALQALQSETQPTQPAISESRATIPPVPETQASQSLGSQSQAAPSVAPQTQASQQPAPASQSIAPKPAMIDRGNTAEPIPPPPIPEPAPTQLSTADPSSSSSTASVSATLPTDSELLRLNADLSAQIASVKAELADARAKKASAEKDSRFLRARYDEASTSAVREVALNRELTAKLAIREAQLDNGLKQKDMHFAAVAARDRQLVAELRAQNKMLLDQARLTGDAIRAKAVAYPATKKENEELLRENAVLERRVENLGKRNEELVDQVRALRARQMGILHGGDEGIRGEDTDTGSEYSDDGSGSGSGGGSPHGSGQDMARMGHATRAKNQTSSGEYSESAPLPHLDIDGEDVGAEQKNAELEVKVEEVELGEETDGPGMAFECQVRSQEGDTVCGQLMDTRTVLHAHWKNDHLPHVQPLSQ